MSDFPSWASSLLYVGAGALGTYVMMRVEVAVLSARVKVLEERRIEDCTRQETGLKSISEEMRLEFGRMRGDLNDHQLAFVKALGELRVDVYARQRDPTVGTL